jgi:hypothetical protein
MRPPPYLALDVGSLMTKIGMPRDGVAPQLTSRVTDAGSPRRFLSRLLADVRAQLDGDLGHVCFAIPDNWLDGDVGGAYRHEAFRHVVEDELGVAAVSWVSQLSAVAALAATLRRSSGPATYLVCDVGGTGVRAALCEVNGQEIRPLATDTASGGGWQEFSGALRAALPAGGALDLESWYLTAPQQQARAALVLAEAATDPAFRDARAYSLPGSGEGYDLTAGQLIDGFASTAERLRHAISAVLGGMRPTVAVLTGGLAWFPLAAQAVAGGAGIQPEILDPQAAAYGALLLARGTMRLPSISLPPVSIPLHRVSNGLLQEARLALPWTSSFAAAGDEQVFFDSPNVLLDIAGQLSAVHLPGLAPGRYRIGVRSAGSGQGLLVLRSDRQAANPAVHIGPFDLEHVNDR